jgi:FkbM family methyltransferase
MDGAGVTSLEVVEIRGVKIPIDPTIMSDYIQEALRTGEYENAEAKRLFRIVEQGERVLELGGGIGYLSALIGNLGLAEHIATVEANPALIDLIKTTHALNGVRAEVINGAVVAQKTTETLSFSLSAHFWASSLKLRKAKEVVSTIEVPALSLGDLVREHRPTFMIIDVEGTEVELLENPEDLAGVRKVLLEVHERAFGPRGVKQLFDYFSAAGFYPDLYLALPCMALFRRLE